MNIEGKGDVPVFGSTFGKIAMDVVDLVPDPSELPNHPIHCSWEEEAVF